MLAPPTALPLNYEFAGPSDAKPASAIRCIGEEEKKRKRKDNVLVVTCTYPTPSALPSRSKPGWPGRSHVVTKLADMVLVRIHSFQRALHHLPRRPRAAVAGSQESSLIYILLLHTTAISLEHLLFSRGIVKTQPWLSSGRNTRACW